LVARPPISSRALSRDDLERLLIGCATATAHAQVTAERLALPLDQVTVACGESSFPGVILADGSQQTASVGGAVGAAHRALVAELPRLSGGDSTVADSAWTRSGRWTVACAASPTRTGG
jgi:xanthine dehydrogenase YagR molybdenum-binding subunit